MGHLEDPKLTERPRRWRATSTSASPARRCSSRWTSSPRGLVEMVAGLASAVVLAGYAWWAPVVLAGGVARDALAAARERRLARPEHRGGPRGPAPRRLRLPPGGRAARRQGAPALRAGGLDRRALPRAAQPALRAAVAGHAPARAARGLEPAAGACRERRGVLVDGQRRGRRHAAARSRGDLRERRRRRPA